MDIHSDEFRNNLKFMVREFIRSGSLAHLQVFTRKEIPEIPKGSCVEVEFRYSDGKVVFCNSGEENGNSNKKA